MQRATRPIIGGFHPDPSICRVGKTYFVATSSFEYLPGIPVYSSTDLVTWTQIGNVLERRSQTACVSARPSGGIYAPTLRFHDGRFWLITTNVTGDPGQMILTADDAAGPWSDPVHVPRAHGIDPDIAWDSDNRCFITWSGVVDGVHGIVQAELDPLRGALLSEPRLVWRGSGGQYPEAPHLHRVGDSWYLVIAEGGTERGHCATVARASSPDGPFEPSPSNPLLTARSTSSPVQNVGHADIVQTPDGGWVVVYLGARVSGWSPGWHGLGRETFAARLHWRDGWPEIGEPIEPAAGGPFVENLGEMTELPLSFVSPDTMPAELLTADGDGWTLAGERAGMFVGRRQEHPFMSIRARLVGEAALEIRVDPRHRVVVRQGHHAVRAFAVIGGLEISLGSQDADPGMELEIQTIESSALPGTPECGPDIIIAGLHHGHTYTELGRIDGRYLTTEVAGGFTGRLAGLVAGNAPVRVAEFRYEETLTTVRV